MPVSFAPSTTASVYAIVRCAEEMVRLAAEIQQEAHEFRGHVAAAYL